MDPQAERASVRRHPANEGARVVRRERHGDLDLGILGKSLRTLSVERAAIAIEPEASLIPVA